MQKMEEFLDCEGYLFFLLVLDEQFEGLVRFLEQTVVEFCA
jgi:hypothetical protein